MKITIENLEDGDAKITLSFNGKDYSEIWTDTGSDYATTTGNIVHKLENDGINAENTDIEDLLNDINISDFMSLSRLEGNW